MSMNFPAVAQMLWTCARSLKQVHNNSCLTCKDPKHNNACLPMARPAVSISHTSIVCTKAAPWAKAD